LLLRGGGAQVTNKSLLPFKVQFFFDPESPLEELLEEDEPLSEEVEGEDVEVDPPLSLFDDDGAESDLLSPVSDAGGFPPELAGLVDPVLA